MRYSYPPREKSALVFMLKTLLPFSEAGLMLAFKPNMFFNELEKISHYKRRTLENAWRQAESQKLIQKQADLIKLTELGQQVVRPFIAEHLPAGAKLMVIFDIPEQLAGRRARFRRTLRVWNFKQVQQSVLITSLDHKQSVKKLVEEMELQEYVQLYECTLI